MTITFDTDLCTGDELRLLVELFENNRQINEHLASAVPEDFQAPILEAADANQKRARELREILEQRECARLYRLDKARAAAAARRS